MAFPILSLLIFLPVAGALLLACMPRERAEEMRWVALLLSSLEFALSLPLFFVFDVNTASMQFAEARAWVESAGIGYRLGVDGISMPLVLLTTLLTPVMILSSWTAVTRHVKAYLVCLLLLEGAVVGVFCALDLVLFYVFWEAMLIPMYLLVGVWGGERRIYAAIKFVLFTMAGSLLMLLAILYLYVQSPDRTFDLLRLQSTLQLGATAQVLAFLAFGLAFAIKVPVFPLHTWLPDAHVEAPTAGSVVLAGVLLKMGGYGFLRFCLPLFPQATALVGPVFAALGVVGVIYGALMALAQDDIKKLVAYSSVSHLGVVVVGIFAVNVRGIEGAVFQMINHGLSTGALFLLVGVLYERTHTRRIADYGGLARALPVFSIVFLITTLSSIGLPGLNGFVGEFLILLGAFEAHPLLGVASATGVVLGAVYMLLLAQKILFGPPAGVVARAALTESADAGHAVPHPAAAHADGGTPTADAPGALPDLNTRERIFLFPIVALMFVLGFFPGILLERMHVTVQALLDGYWRALAR